MNNPGMVSQVRDGSKQTDARLEEHLGEAPQDAATAAARADVNETTVSDILKGNGSARLARKPYFSDLIDRSLFLVFSAVGIALLALLKLGLGIYTIGSAVPPVAVLVLYAYFIRKSDYFRLHPDRLGDNCYYMGFIFTLASLSFALIQLEQAVGDARASLLDSLIGNFGIALFSTIAGIALRVYFIQYRREIEDEEEQMRLDLQATATQLKDQLGLAILDLEGFRIRTVQVLEEQLLSSAKEFTRFQQAVSQEAGAAAEKFASFHDDLEKGVRNVANSVVANSRQVTDAVDSTISSANELAMRIRAIDIPPDLLSRHVDLVAQSAQDIVARIEAIDIPSDLVSRQLKQAQASLTRLGTALERAADNEAKRSAAFEGATNDLLRQLAVLTETSRFSKLENAAEQLEHKLAGLTNGIDSLTPAIGSYQHAIASLADNATQERQALAGIREIIERDVRDSAQALTSLEATLADIARGVAARLGR